ncbi:MAG: glycosyltransferase family 1 protein, partial [Vallitaleaceae bacterium]|nr:glycosyltransferase family 1 protein [Vallitaleaceae bacterium]
MKVLHLISGGDSGGAKTSVIILLKQLSRIVDVKLVALVEAEFSEAAREAGIDVVVMPQKTRLDLTVIRRLSHMVNQESYDLVNCHGARANFIGAFLK